MNTIFKAVKSNWINQGELSVEIDGEQYRLDAIPYNKSLEERAGELWERNRKSYIDVEGDDWTAAVPREEFVKSIIDTATEHAAQEVEKATAGMRERVKELEEMCDKYSHLIYQHIQWATHNTEKVPDFQECHDVNDEWDAYAKRVNYYEI